MLNPQASVVQNMSTVFHLFTNVVMFINIIIVVGKMGNPCTVAQCKAMVIARWLASSVSTPRETLLVSTEAGGG